MIYDLSFVITVINHSTRLLGPSASPLTHEESCGANQSNQSASAAVGGDSSTSTIYGVGSDFAW